MTKKRIIFPLLLLISSGFFACMSCNKEENKTDDIVGEQKFTMDTVARNLGNPWGMAFLPNGDILFTERSGELKRIKNSDRSIETIHGTPQVAALGQGGLLDMALHPDYANNGWIYLSYSKQVGSEYTTVIARAKLSGEQLTDFQEIFIASPSFTTTHHFGSRLALKDGYLWFSVGDRGQMDKAQELNYHNGKIMRIMDDGTIPSDNPFAGASGALPEIWSYGHRNPQGLAFHPVTGELWAHEHGPQGGDELNLIKKGANYGWPVITYGIDYDGTIISPDTAKAGMEQPVTYWRPSIAPCGMVFCNSDQYPAWKNNIFLGGLASTALWRVELNGNQYKNQEKLLAGIARVRNVALSPDGFLYIATESPGYIFRMVPE